MGSLRSSRNKKPASDGGLDGLGGETFFSRLIWRDHPLRWSQSLRDEFPILPPNSRRMIQHVREKFDLGDDVLRHTYISMHVAKFRSVGDAALQAGNSEAMVRKHYLNSVAPAEAEEFWNIRPTGVAD